MEGFGEFAADAAVVFDVEAGEDGLVELASLPRRGVFVGGLEIGGEVEAACEVGEYVGVVVLGVVDALFDVAELGADAVLFGLEQVEWDGVGEVGFEELGAFGFECLAALPEEFAFCCCFGEERLEFLSEPAFERLPDFGGELLAGVVGGDFVFDCGDEDGAECAVGASVVAS